MGCGLSRIPANGSGDATTQAGAISSAVAPIETHPSVISKRMALEIKRIGAAERISEGMTTSAGGIKSSPSITTSSRVALSGQRTSSRSNITETLSSKTMGSSGHFKVANAKVTGTESSTKCVTKTTGRKATDTKSSSTQSAAKGVSRLTAATVSSAAKTIGSTATSLHSSSHSKVVKKVSSTMTNRTGNESVARSANSYSYASFKESSGSNTTTRDGAILKESAQCKAAVRGARVKTQMTTLTSDSSSRLSKTSQDVDNLVQSRPLKVLSTSAISSNIKPGFSRTSGAASPVTVTSKGSKRSLETIQKTSKMCSTSSGHDMRSERRLSITQSVSTEPNSIIKTFRTSGNESRLTSSTKGSDETRETSWNTSFTSSGHQIHTERRLSKTRTVSKVPNSIVSSSRNVSKPTSTANSSRTSSSRTASSKELVELTKEASQMCSTSDSHKRSSECRLSEWQSVSKAPAWTVNYQSSTGNRVKTGRGNEIISTKPQIAKVSKDRKSTEDTRAASSVGKTSKREVISKPSHASEKLRNTPRSSTAGSVNEDECSSTDASDSESTLAPSIKLNSQTDNLKTPPNQAPGPSTIASHFCAMEKPSRQEQCNSTLNITVDDSSNAFDKEAENVELETITDSSSDDTLAPTCSASSWKRSGSSSIASEPLGVANRVQFYNCNESSDMADIVDDSEDYYFRPAPWCRSESGDGTGRRASVVLDVRRASQTTVSAHEAYLQYWVSSWTVAASGSESSLVDDDRCATGDSPLSGTMNGRSSSAAAEGSTKLDNVDGEDNIRLGTGDAPRSAAKENYSDDVHINLQLQEASSATSISSSINSVKNQPPASVSVRNNINNSAVVGLIASEFLESATGIGGSATSWVISDSVTQMPRPTSSCITLDSARVTGGKLLLESNVCNELEQEMWQVLCQQVTEEYQHNRQNPENSHAGCRIDLNGTRNSIVNGDNNSGCVRVKRYEEPNNENTIKTRDKKIFSNQPTVVKSWSYAERVDSVQKVQVLEHNSTSTVDKLPSAVLHLQELRHLLPKSLQQSYQDNVISWQQPLNQFSGTMTTDATSIRGNYFSADDIWTDEINDTDADSGIASRCTATELTGLHSSKSLSPQFEELMDFTHAIAMKQKQLYQPEKESVMFEKTNSINDDISESVAAIGNPEYDAVASFEQLEDANSIDDLSACMSPSGEGAAPLPTLEEMNGASSELFNVYTPLGDVRGANHAVLSDHTIITKTMTRPVCEKSSVHKIAPLNSVPVGRLKLKNNGLNADLLKWWENSENTGSLPIVKQAICLGFDSYSDSEIAQKHVGGTALPASGPPTTSNTSIRAMTPSLRSRSPGSYLSPGEAGSSRESIQSYSPKSRIEFGYTTPERGSSQASASSFSPPGSSPSGDERPSSGRTPACSSPVLQNTTPMPQLQNGTASNISQAPHYMSTAAQLQAERTFHDKSPVSWKVMSKPLLPADCTPQCLSPVLENMTPLPQMQNSTAFDISQAPKYMSTTGQLQAERTFSGTSPVPKNGMSKPQLLADCTPSCSSHVLENMTPLPQMQNSTAFDISQAPKYMSTAGQLQAESTFSGTSPVPKNGMSKPNLLAECTPPCSFPVLENMTPIPELPNITSPGTSQAPKFTSQAVQCQAESTFYCTSPVKKNVMPKPQLPADLIPLCSSHVLQNMTPLPQMQNTTASGISQAQQFISTSAQLQAARTFPRTSNVLLNIISQLSELQSELKARIIAAEAAGAHHSRTPTTVSPVVLSEAEAVDLAKAMASAKSLADKLNSLMRDRSLKEIEKGAGCCSLVHSMCSITTEVSVSVEKGSQRAHRNHGRSPQTPTRMK